MKQRAPPEWLHTHGLYDPVQAVVTGPVTCTIDCTQQNKDLTVPSTQNLTSNTDISVFSFFYSRRQENLNTPDIIFFFRMQIFGKTQRKNVTKINKKYVKSKQFPDFSRSKPNF